MPRVNTEPFYSIRATTSSRMSWVVLILLSMSLFLSGKTFGAAIFAEAVEFDGKDYSSIPPDQTTEWQWSRSPSSFDGNVNLIKTDVYNKGEWQTIRSEEKNLFSEPQTGHRYLMDLTIKDFDRFITREDFLPVSHEIANYYSLSLYVIMFSIAIGLGASKVWLARAILEKSAHRRKYRLRRRRRFPFREKWLESERRNVKNTYFHSDPPS